MIKRKKQHEKMFIILTNDSVWGIYIKDQWNHVKLIWLIHWASEGGNGEREREKEQRKTVQLTINCNDVKGEKKIWENATYRLCLEWEERKEGVTNHL